MAVEQNQLNVATHLHEATFLTNYATKPVKEWFSGWDEKFLKKIEKFDLFHMGALIVLSDERNFYITQECADLYASMENDIFKSMEQNIVYCKMRELPPEQYTIVRKFIVKHPVCSQKGIRQFKMEQQNSISEIEEILSDAYENIPKGSYRCPECGWTMCFHGYQAVCCNPSCIEHHPQKEDLSPLSTDDMRLIHGVMRYMSLSGKLELEIQEKAENSGCKTILYPNCDEYDVQITLPNGTIWAIDAKTHQSPYILANQIKQDSFFANVPADKRFYVIPKKRTEKFPDYCDICNQALQEQNKDAECITENELYQRLREAIK